MKLSPSSEDYLKTILILQKKQGLVRSIDLAQYLGYTKASISRAVNNLRKGGLLTVDSNHFLHLTPTGQRAAEEVYEKYHILTSLLVGLQVSPSQAEADACRMEHSLSEESYQRLKAAALSQHRNQPTPPSRKEP